MTTTKHAGLMTTKPATAVGSASEALERSEQTLPATLERQKLERAIKRLDALAHLMDDRYEIPILRTKIGLDPIIGLIPGGGDWATWAIGIYIFWEAVRLGMPIHVLGRMVVNIAIDLLGGYVPVAGDVFDVVYRSNKRNVELVRGYLGGEKTLDAPLPQVLPARVERALARSAQKKTTRYAFALVVSVLSFLVASGPFILLYLLLRG